MNMLRIRQSQMEKFDNASLDQFVRKMIEQVRKTFPEQVAGFDHGQLHDFICTSVDEAETNGVDTEEEVEIYIGYAVRFGQEFNQQDPWAPVLKDPDLTAEEKIEALEEIPSGDLPAAEYVKQTSDRGTDFIGKASAASSETRVD
jgi:hypothetical protein